MREKDDYVGGYRYSEPYIENSPTENRILFNIDPRTPDLDHVEK